MAINIANYDRQTTILENTVEILDKVGKGKVKKRQTFTTSGDWVCPQGVTQVLLTGGGAGGGGAVAGVGNASGTAGGVTSFGSLITLSGGGGGTDGVNAVGGLPGGPGGQSGAISSSTSSNFYLGDGGSGGMFKGGKSRIGTASNLFMNGGYCSGGGSLVNNGVAGCGGSGDFVEGKPVDVTPGNTYKVSIGTGGNGGQGYGGRGGNGILIIDWEE